MTYKRGGIMDKISLNSIVVGLTAIVSILVGGFLTYIFQTKDSGKKIKLIRLDQIEKVETENFFDAKELLSHLEQCNGDSVDAHNIRYSIASIQNKLVYLNAMANVLDNKELNLLLFVFQEVFGEFTTSIDKALSSIKDEKRNNDLFRIAGELYGKLQIPFTNIIKQLDKIRTEVTRQLR
jgi:hypothetical protein